MDLQTGDILLHKGKRWTSRIIAKVTGSPYTHVAIVFDTNRVLEIDINKELSLYQIDSTLRYEVYRKRGGLTKQEKIKLKRRMTNRQLEMKGYDWLKLISLGFLAIFKKPFFMDTKNKVICSEIVDMLYNEIGIDLVPGAIVGHVTPEDIAKSPNIEYLKSI